MTVCLSVEVGAVAEPAEGSAGRVFISYRREETAYPAGWLYARLASRYGGGQVFKKTSTPSSWGMTSSR
jgi:hypothetical protein